MKGRGSYVPPPYIPLGQSDREPEAVTATINNVNIQPPDGPLQWSSGICACCDDMQSCCVGCFIGCYAYNYRKNLRTRYNLQEAPCGDFATHFCCHLCAICQEYREIRERSEDPNYADLKLPEVTPPAVQKMEHAPEE